MLQKCVEIIFITNTVLYITKSFSGFAQMSLGLNILNSETNRLMAITYSKLQILRTSIQCQTSSKFV